MAKVLSEAARQYQEETRQRVSWILGNVFGWRQRRMAEAMNVPQSQISRIVNGQIGPSIEFLNAMAGLPGINPDWVRRGDGEPMLQPTRGTLPVAQGVLPGLPHDNQHLLSGQRHPVAEALDRTSRYWLELRPTSPVIGDPSLKLLPGDLLLIEAAAEWTTRVDLIMGRLCGARLEVDRSEPSYVLGKMSQDSVGMLLDTIAVFINLSEKTRPPESEAAPDSGTAEEPSPPPSRPRMRRKIRPLEERREQIKAHEQKIKAQEQQEGQRRSVFRVRLEEVVGVCVYMTRPAPVASPTAATPGV